ncbi:LOW QUALITY PROTEIN: protein-associating with the carboxyl-terminal domain of ezrin [Drosophila subpulchrella]|uniref:LOW QUALITY PROTEIN: protein-associating with the carboxyl-terminal domain of ezrin n=1 Tax=Drosophila subpulchrella TaxID=1486046 RepID=UPI0018A1AF78|nr:LOW QUALITY PROTEIN: protein-associating with the carboxyl-terminal domain of ezrin [Drosophila subpulchrella]
MGSEGSKLKGLILEKNAVEANEYWKLYNAESPAACNDEDCRKLLSIFQGEVFVKRHVWAGGMGPMERAIKNLMVYRHPYILKYVATWDQSGQKHLATERVRPLNEVLTHLTDLEICLGLRTILCSLIFLIEKALARHLNINTHSIYVTDRGSWRLAGFEYVWRATEVDKPLIDLAHSLIDANISEENCEQFAFAMLCEKVLERSGTNSGDGNSTPHAHEFREYCGAHLKHQNTKLRPTFSAVLLHPYFNHEFVLIHSFLFELPLKSVQERHAFFGSLIKRLQYFDEEVVASQLACDLLSRMVLLDPAAQEFVTPHILRTKSTVNTTVSLFSPRTYVQYLMPHILKMFRLRDAQIRLILLDYFMDFVCLLGIEQLQSEILPHLQMGMSDTNDILVAKTLRCMADLVSILGASNVLGGERSRCFSDGRPLAAVSTRSPNTMPEPRSISPLMDTRAFDVGDDFMVSSSPLPTENNVPLSLRNSPDGGEDRKIGLNLNEKSLSVCQNSDPETDSNVTVAGKKKLVNLDEEGIWSHWDTTDVLQRLHVTQTGRKEQTLTDLVTESSASIRNSQAVLSSHSTAILDVSLGASKALLQSDRKIIDDLSALDIQVQSVTQGTELAEFDFFKDMEPVIEIKTRSCETNERINSRFAAAALTANRNDVDAENGWGHNEQDGDVVVWGATNETVTS